MSLPLVILSSIALMLDTTEAAPYLPVNKKKRAAETEKEFHNTSTTTVKKSTTTTTTKKSTSTSAAAATTTTSKKTSTTSKKVSSNAASATVSAPSPSGTSVIPMLIPVGTGTTNAVNTVSSTSIPSATALAETNSGGVSGGAIGGIVAAVVIIILGAVAYFIVRRKKNNKNRSRDVGNKPDPFTMGYGSDQAFHSQQQPMQQQQSYQHQYGVQPTVAVTSPTSPTYYNNNNNNSQFQDANNHIIADSMKSTQQQYQPQLNEQYNNENIDPPAPIPAAVAAPIVTTSVNNKLLSPTQAGSVGVFHVAATYTPTLSDEIDIQTGDQVEVLVEYDDGWCQGINLSRGNAKGVFPKHCIDYASGVSSSGNSIDRVKRISSMYTS